MKPIPSACSRTYPRGAAEHGIGFGGGFVPEPQILENVATEGVDLGSEISDRLKLFPPQVPNQKSDSDGWHGVGKPWGRAIERTPHCGSTTLDAIYI